MVTSRMRIWEWGAACLLNMPESSPATLSSILGPVPATTVLLHAKRLEQRAGLSGWILRRTCCLKQGKMRNDEVFTNVEFLEGDIENMPLPDAMADVIVSNCVLNLLPRKDRIFKEIYRVLKPGARFCISDVVLDGLFPQEFTDNAAMYAGCIASAIQRRIISAK